MRELSQLLLSLGHNFKSIAIGLLLGYGLGFNLPKPDALGFYPNFNHRTTLLTLSAPIFRSNVEVGHLLGSQHDHVMTGAKMAGGFVHTSVQHTGDASSTHSVERRAKFVDSVAFAHSGGYLRIRPRVQTPRIKPNYNNSTLFCQPQTSQTVKTKAVNDVNNPSFSTDSGSFETTRTKLKEKSAYSTFLMLSVSAFCLCASLIGYRCDQNLLKVLVFYAALVYYFSEPELFGMGLAELVICEILRRLSVMAPSSLAIYFFIGTIVEMILDTCVDIFLFVERSMFLNMHALNTIDWKTLNHKGRRYLERLRRKKVILPGTTAFELTPKLPFSPPQDVEVHDVKGKGVSNRPRPVGRDSPRYEIIRSREVIWSTSFNDSDRPAATSVKELFSPQVEEASPIVYARYNPRDYRRIKVIQREEVDSVYVVEHRTTNQLFVLRTAHMHTFSRQSMLRELRALSFLTESFWFPVLMDMAVNQAMAHGLMGYYPRGNLAGYVRQAGCCLDPPLARFYLAEMLAAVGVLHSHKVVHTRISLENILLTDEGHLVLSNFSNCIISTDSLTENVQPPDSAIGRRAAVQQAVKNGQVDLYDAAATFYTLITGKVIEFKEYRSHESIAVWNRDQLQKLGVLEYEFVAAIMNSFPWKVHSVEKMKRRGVFKLTDWDAIHSGKAIVPRMVHYSVRVPEEKDWYNLPGDGRSTRRRDKDSEVGKLNNANAESGRKSKRDQLTMGGSLATRERLGSKKSEVIRY